MRLGSIIALGLMLACSSDEESGPAGSGGTAGGVTGGSGGVSPAGSGGGAGSGGTQTGGSAGAALGGAGGVAAAGGTSGTSGVVPGASWTTKPPAEVGLDESALTAFSQSIGGRGVVVRNGYLVYTWGNPAQRSDIASAAKPIYGFFLFKALEKKLIASIDDKVAPLIPGLSALNPSLGNKDANITFRHFSTQTSCYGVSEEPGKAFDYNDWQMALFWDTLFLKVWGASYDNVDAKVLEPELCAVLQCEDQPTFMAFGTNDRPGRVAISPRDFARFGLLYLRGGSWDGTPLLPSATLTQIVTSPLPNSIPQTQGTEAEMLPGQRSIGSKAKPDNQTDHLGSYSFMWWVNGVDRNGKMLYADAPKDTYMASGHGGKRGVVVIPSLDVIISWNATNISDFPGVNQALKSFMAAVK